MSTQDQFFFNLSDKMWVSNNDMLSLSIACVTILAERKNETDKTAR